MRLKESINQNQINLLKAAYGDIKKIDPNSAAVKKLMMVLKKLSKDDLETISKAKINFVSTMAQSILRDSNVSESAEMDNLQKRKNDLLKQVDPLIAKKKKLYSDVDITTPKSSDEKKLDKEIADLFSEINDLVHKIVKLKKSQNEGRNTMKLKLAVTEEIAVGKMVKVVNNPHWEAALGKKGPFKRKVKMIDGDNVFFIDGSNSSMKYIKESVNEATLINSQNTSDAQEIAAKTKLSYEDGWNAITSYLVATMGLPKALALVLKLEKEYHKIVSESVNEATNLAKMMAGIKKGSQTGPWTIVVSFNKKVYYQTQVKTKNEIPAKFEHMKKVTNIPGYIFTIEDNTGMTVYSEKLLNEAKKYDIGSGYLGNGLTIWNRAEEKDGDYETIAHIGKDGKLTIYDKEIPADIKKMFGIWATSMKKGNRPGSY